MNSLKMEENVRIKLKEKFFSFLNFDKNKLDLYCDLMTFYDLDINLLINQPVISHF